MLRALNVVSLCVAILALSVTRAAAEEAALPAVKAENIRTHIDYLASDDLAGRDSGEPGLEVAAEYIARVYKSYGLEPAGDNGTYFEHFTVPRGAAFGREAGVTISLASGQETFWNPGADVEAFGFGEAGVVNASIVFAGYGVTTTEAERDKGLDYDDYAGVDVKGKIVIILRFVPQHDQKDGKLAGRRSPHAPFVAKLRNAKNHGAAGVIIVTPPGSPDDDPYGISHRAAPNQPTVPAVYARRGVVERLLRSRGKSLAALTREIDEKLAPRSFEIPGSRARFSTTRRHLRLRNVAGRLPGSDPKLAHETLVIGGHYDHIGRYGNQVNPRNLGKVHNGADDNASGIAAILESARLLSQGPRPRRSVAFVCFSGEEIGLLGSRHWVDAPRHFVTRGFTRALPSPSPHGGGATMWEVGTAVRATGKFQGELVEVQTLSGSTGWVKASALKQTGGNPALHDIVSMINLDMVGHAKADGACSVIGVQSSEGFPKLIEELSKQTGVPVKGSGKGMLGGGSDHAHFLRRGIPALFFFTGIHGRYNTPEDDLETLNIEGEAGIVDVVRRTALRLTNSDERPKFNAQIFAQQGSPHGGGGRPQLGILIDAEHKGAGVRVLSVVDDSVAKKSGIQAGDIIVKLGKAKITTPQDLLASLTEEAKGKVKIIVQRGGKETTIDAAFPEAASSGGGFGVRFGSVPDYAWAEKGVRFEAITPNTPAAKGGVKGGDVLLRWNGKEVGDVQEWTNFLRQHKPGDVVKIEVDRAGKKVELTVKLEGR